MLLDVFNISNNTIAHNNAIIVIKATILSSPKGLLKSI